MTSDGWRRFVDTAPAQVDLLPENMWKELSPLEREAYDDDRFAYHAKLVIVKTSAISEITKQSRLLTLLNQASSPVS